jgi:hypothetical protein
MDAKVFEQRARDCRDLAAACPDFYARAALIELADEFMRMAQQLSEAARNSRARSRTPRRETSHRGDAIRTSDRRG